MNPHLNSVPREKSLYRHFQDITLRWGDNDVYGHANNVRYFSALSYRLLIVLGNLL
jgi:hypothetical protein